MVLDPVIGLEAQLKMVIFSTRNFFLNFTIMVLEPPRVFFGELDGCGMEVQSFVPSGYHSLLFLVHNLQGQV